MNILDLEEGVKICADYLSKANKVLEMLKSDITEYLVTIGVLTVAGTAVVMVGTAGVAGAGEH